MVNTPLSEFVFAIPRKGTATSLQKRLRLRRDGMAKSVFSPQKKNPAEAGLFMGHP
jgi:hypothetical protein